jgi:hypothetical protein
VAFPNRLVMLGPLLHRESKPRALGLGSLVHDSPGVLEAAEPARIADGGQAANGAMAWTGWWRHGSLLMEPVRIGGHDTVRDWGSYPM